MRIPRIGSVRPVHPKPGATVTYRLDRGDIIALREVWIYEYYRLTFTVSCGTLVDLGANIGLVSLWYARHLEFKHIVADEPLAANARLLRMNLAQNGVAADVVEAAIPDRDGTVTFAAAGDFASGRLADDGVEVKTISIESVLGRLSDGSDIDLMKVDIEGAERGLLEHSPRWLGRVRELAVEVHRDLVDAPSLITAVETTDLRHVTSGAARAGELDGFMRDASGTVRGTSQPRFTQPDLQAATSTSSPHPERLHGHRHLLPQLALPRISTPGRRSTDCTRERATRLTRGDAYSSCTAVNA